MTVPDGPPFPPGIALLRSEDVLLLAVPLPQMTPAQRRVAVGFAVEDMIAQPLESVAVILGPELPTQRWLVAVADPAVLVGGGARMRLIPDVLVLPVPAAGEWSVWAGAARVLVRVADGTGFATMADAFDTYHLAAGRPGIVLYGGVLPGGFAALQERVLPSRLEPLLDRFDLRQSAGAQAGRLPRAMRRFAVLAVVAGLAHTAVSAADIMLLGQYRDSLRVQVDGRLQSLGLSVTPDVDTALTNALSQGDAAAAPPLLPLLTQVFGAMGGQAGLVTLRDLRFASDALVVTVEAPDLTTLQAVETALAGAGLGVVAGAATTGNGLAEQQLTITGGAP